MKCVVSFAVTLVVHVLLVAYVSGQGNPCSGTFCTRGRICIPHNEGGKTWTTCDCPSSCPATDDPVCSIYYNQYRNRCLLNEYACSIGMSIAIKNRGRCTEPKDLQFRRLTECPEWKLLQFPYRYIEWLIIAREMSTNQQFTLPSRRGEELRQDEINDILTWEFHNWDSNRNGVWDKAEVDRVEKILLPLESCVYGFLKSCDLDGGGSINQREWRSCFPEGDTGGAIGSRL